MSRYLTSLEDINNWVNLNEQWTKFARRDVLTNTRIGPTADSEMNNKLMLIHFSFIRANVTYTMADFNKST